MSASCSALTMSRNSSKLFTLLRRAGVAAVEGQESERHVSPVRPFLGIRLEDRHEFDGGDPECFEIRDLVDHPRVGARPIRGYAG
jgi:hypothetical protein